MFQRHDTRRWSRLESCQINVVDHRFDVARQSFTRRHDQPTVLIVDSKGHFHAVLQTVSASISATAATTHQSGQRILPAASLLLLRLRRRQFFFKDVLNHLGDVADERVSNGDVMR